MSTQTLQGISAPSKYPSVECRVWERFPCDLPSICQPIAARGDHDVSWPAQIRDLSQGGVGVILKRRFERGAGLAIDIPEADSTPATTLLGRVVHTTSLPGGLWLHGCAFVSLLSEDEVNRLLCLGQANSSPHGNASVHVIENVTLQAVAGDRPPYQFRRLHVKGTWPLAPGKMLKVWFGTAPHAQAFLRIERCVEEAGNWLISYRLVDSQHPEMQKTFV